MTDTTARRELRKPNWGDAALLLLIGSVWGSSFLPLKVAIYETGPVMLVFLRSLAALPPLFMFMLWRGASLPGNRFDISVIFVMSLLNSVIPFLLLSWAGYHVSSGVMALIMGTGPLVTLLVTHFSTHDDRLNGWKLLGVLIGMAGLVVIIGPDAVGGLTQNLLGDLAVFGAITCYVCATAMVRKVRSTRIEGIAAANMLVSVLVLLPFVLLMPHPAVSAYSLTTVYAILYLGMVTTGVGYVLRYTMVVTVGQSFTSLASYIMPIVGVLLGVVFLDEHLSANIVLALGLVLAGFAIARRGA